MPYISLSVIGPEKQQAGEKNESEKQIFINDASPDLIEMFRTASDDNAIPILVNGIFDILICDPNLIRRDGQKTAEQSEDFISLYSFLACWPEEVIEFDW